MESEILCDTDGTNYRGLTRRRASHSRLLQGVSKLVSSSSLRPSSVSKHKRALSDASTVTFISMSEDASLSSSVNILPVSKIRTEQTNLPEDSTSNASHSNVNSNSIGSTSSAVASSPLEKQQLGILDHDLGLPENLNVMECAINHDITQTNCNEHHSSIRNNEEIDFSCIYGNQDFGQQAKPNSMECTIRHDIAQNSRNDDLFSNYDNEQIELSCNKNGDSKCQHRSQSPNEVESGICMLFQKECTIHSTCSATKSESSYSSLSTGSLRSPLIRKLQVKLLQASPNDQYDAVAVGVTARRVPCSLLDDENKSVSSSNSESSFDLAKASLLRNSSAPNTSQSKFSSEDHSASISAIGSTSSFLPKARLSRAGSAPTLPSTSGSVKPSNKATRTSRTLRPDKSRKQRKKKRNPVEVLPATSSNLSVGKSSSHLSKPVHKRTVSDSSCLSRNTTRSAGPIDVDTVVDLYGDDLSTSSNETDVVCNASTKELVFNDARMKETSSVSSLADSVTVVSSTMYGRKPLPTRIESDKSLVSVLSERSIETEASCLTEKSCSGGPVDVDDFIPRECYYLYDRHYLILDEREFSRGLAGYEVGFEPEVIWDFESYQASRKFSPDYVPSAICEEDEDEEGNEVVLGRNMNQNSREMDERYRSRTGTTCPSVKFSV